MSIAWANGKLTQAAIRSLVGEPATVRYGGKTIKLELKAGESSVLDAELNIK